MYVCMYVCNVMLACFDLHTTLNKPAEREISFSNKATLSQSELIQMLFISYGAC